MTPSMNFETKNWGKYQLKKSDSPMTSPAQSKSSSFGYFKNTLNPRGRASDLTIEAILTELISCDLFLVLGFLLLSHASTTNR